MAFIKRDLSVEDVEDLAISLGLSTFFTRCLGCNLWNTSLAGKSECGNCGSRDTILYIPSNMVLKLLEKIRESDGIKDA